MNPRCVFPVSAGIFQAPSPHVTTKDKLLCRN
jgi:hypothetical protein